MKPFLILGVILAECFGALMLAMKNETSFTRSSVRRGRPALGLGSLLLWTWMGCSLSFLAPPAHSESAASKETAPGSSLPPSAAAKINAPPGAQSATGGLPQEDAQRLSNSGSTPANKGSQFDANNRTVPQANTESPLSVVAGDPEGLGLLECYQLAAVRSDTLQIDDQSIRAARARLYQAVAQLFPTVNLVNTENFQKSSSTSGSFTVFGGTVTNNGGKLYSNSTRLTLSQTLFDGFTNYNNVGAANADVAAQRYSLQYAYQTLYQEVAQSFYQILSEQADLLVLSDSIRALEGQVELLEKWVHIGRSRPSELLQVKAQLAGVKVSVEQIKGMLAASKELMAFYLGIPAAKIKLHDVQKFPTASTLETYLRTVGTRPDILSQVEQERMARRQLSAAKGALWPTVSATGSYNLTTYPQQSQEWVAALEISLPLFDGGLIINRISEQKALFRQSELNVENLRRTADQNLRTAFDNFDSSAAQVVALKEQVEMSALNYNAQAEDYKSGIVSNLDVLTALNTLQGARQALSDADVNARLNLVLLHVAAGSVPTSLPKPKVTSASGTSAPAKVP